MKIISPHQVASVLFCVGIFFSASLRSDPVTYLRALRCLDRLVALHGWPGTKATDIVGGDQIFVLRSKNEDQKVFHIFTPEGYRRVKVPAAAKEISFELRFKKSRYYFTLNISEGKINSGHTGPSANSGPAMLVDHWQPARGKPWDRLQAGIRELIPLVNEHYEQIRNDAMKNDLGYVPTPLGYNDVFKMCTDMGPEVDAAAKTEAEKFRKIKTTPIDWSKNAKPAAEEIKLSLSSLTTYRCYGGYEKKGVKDLQTGEVCDNQTYRRDPKPETLKIKLRPESGPDDDGQIKTLVGSWGEEQEFRGRIFSIALTLVKTETKGKKVSYQITLTGGDDEPRTRDFSVTTDFSAAKEMNPLTLNYFSRGLPEEIQYQVMVSALK